MLQKLASIALRGNSLKGPLYAKETLCVRLQDLIPFSFHSIPFIIVAVSQELRSEMLSFAAVL